MILYCCARMGKAVDPDVEKGSLAHEVVVVPDFWMLRVLYENGMSM